MTKDNSAKLAVLIDADNSSAKKIPLILQEVAKYGVASVKRVYGDWSSENLKIGVTYFCLMRLHLYNSLPIRAVKTLPI